MADTIHTLTEQIGRALAFLNDVVAISSGSKDFINALGWELPAGVDDIGLSALDFTDFLEKLNVVLESSESDFENEIVMVPRIAELGLAGGALANSIRELAETLPVTLGAFGDYVDRTNIHVELPRRIFDFLLINQLSDRSPFTLAILNFLNIIEFKHFPADPENFQVQHLRAIVHYDHVKTFITDPAEHMATAYGWGTPQFADSVLINRVSQVLRTLGMPVQFTAMDLRGEAAILGQPPLDPATLPVVQMMVTLYEKLGDIAGLKLGATMFGVRPTSEGAADGGLGFLPIIRGVAQASIPFLAFDDTFFDLSAEGDLLRRTAVIMRPGDSLEVKHARGISDAVTGQFAIRLRRGSPESEPRTLLSFPGGVSIQAQQTYLAAGLEKFSDGLTESFVELGLLGSRVQFSLEDADSFLKDSIQQEKVAAGFDLRVGWTSRQGIYFHGSSGLTVSIPAHSRLGPFTLSSVTLGLNVADEELALESSVSGNLSLGPILVNVQRIGLQVDVTFGEGNLGLFGLSPKFKFPSALGLSIDAGGFKGGGFIEFEPEEARYSGMLELEFQDLFTLKAIALLNTRLPNGQEGFSLLIVISAEFTPIQLGLGFKLNGVGGLLGLNRTVNIEPLRTGLRDNTLSSILFPTDIVANADRIISDLRQVFPPMADRFIFGPMAKIAWGTPTLVTVDLGLVIEVPEPIRLLILGVLRAVLPDENAAILRVQVNFLGELNFERRQLKFDASLFDSKLLGFTLSGDMALRLDWGADKNFLLTVGGFHPAYQPPAMDLPAIRRLTLSLLEGDNPRLKLEMYFAVTSNTAQFGARLELYAAAWKFNVYGFLTFDVLFQFNPFYFIAEITAMLALRVGSSSFASIKLTLTLEGPTPWKAQGTAKFKICWFFTLKVRFNKTFGETRNTTLPDVAVLPLLRAALEANDNWEGELPPQRHRLESIRETPGALLIHPVGTLKVSQKVVPLKVRIDRIGSQRPSDGREFAIADVQPEANPEAVQESFAPAQFFDLTDEEKLTSPSFRQFESGVRIGDPERLHTGYAALRQVAYELKYIDSQRQQRLATDPRPFPVDIVSFNAWTLSGAISQSPLSFARNRKSSLAPEAVAVEQEQFAIVNTGDLTLFDDLSVMGNERAAAARLNTLVEQNPRLRGALQVVPAFELAA